MMHRVLRGLKQAAALFHTTAAVREEILRFGLASADRLVQAPLGHAPEFRAEPQPDETAERIMASLQVKPFLLHVGSCIPRKRVDFLLQVFAAARVHRPDLHLIKVGGTWTAEHEQQIRQLHLEDALVHLHGISRLSLAVLYRHASLVLLPSETEGFGLPVVEALACGAPVLASDLPVLREVGGAAVSYAPVGDLVRWRELVLQMLANETSDLRVARLAQARPFTWEAHARIIAETYRGLLA